MKKTSTLLLVVILIVGIYIYFFRLSSAKNDLIAAWPHELPASRKTVLENLIENMVKVEGGSYSMGYDWDDKSLPEFAIDEMLHDVKVSTFYLGKYEVTQAEWCAVMGYNPSTFTENQNYPVENISWDDCQTFIDKLNYYTGLSFRLPTEAEWEFAARGGVENKRQSYLYSGSNNINDVAIWYEVGSSTAPVGSRDPNALGLYDMSGNVWEWCHDYYDYYDKDVKNNPQGPSYGARRVTRGGGWRSRAENCRISNRGADLHERKQSVIGLRLAL